MAHRVCPWWLGYWLASPVRRWRQDPGRIVGPYVREGMTVFEPGPGMGFFTVELARRVGGAGRVVVVDVQPRMVAGLKRRAAKAGLAERIDARVGSADAVVEELRGAVDFTLAFAMVHEMPEAERFFAAVAAMAKPGATVLLAEPRGHVDEEEFAGELRAAAAAGLVVAERPAIARSVAALLRKGN